MQPVELLGNEWVETLVNGAAADEKFQKKAKKFNAVYQYVVPASPEEGVENGYEFWIKFPEAKMFETGKHDKPDYTMTTSYRVFHDILTDKTNAIKALTTRKAFVSGNLANLLRFNGAINRIVELMKEIPATGAGDYSDINPR